MERIILFGILSIPVVIVSRRSLFKLKVHGFYRFLAWECIIWLFVSNYPFWFRDAFNLNQVVSWIFLLVSIYMAVAGAIHIKKMGMQEKSRDDKALFQFEKTTRLVDRGIYTYIRHPLYSSLLFLTWGIFLKHTSYFLLLIALLSTAFLFITAVFDEKECLTYFGEKYRDYMNRSKRFIPHIL